MINYNRGIVREFLEQNNALESSEEYIRIKDEVDREVDIIYATEHIKLSERRLLWLKEQNSVEHYKEEEQRLKQAKELIHKDPGKAAELYWQLGCCHEFWAIRKRLLKVKYGMVWYTPKEVEPYVMFD